MKNLLPKGKAVISRRSFLTASTLLASGLMKNTFKAPPWHVRLCRPYCSSHLI